MKALAVKTIPQSNKYFAILLTQLNNLASQKVQLISYFIHFPFAVIVIISLWSAVYGMGFTEIAGFSYSAMVAYLILSAFVNRVIDNDMVGDLVEEDITEGNFISNLCRPIEHWKYRFAHRFAQNILFAPIAIIILIAIFPFFSIPYPPSYYWILFVLFLGAATLFSFFIYYTIGLLAFWIERTWGIRWSYKFVSDILTGAIFPIALYPPFVQTILTYTPFPHQVYTPVALMIGRIGLNEAIQGLGILMGWTVILFLLAMQLWKMGLAKYDGKM